MLRTYGWGAMQDEQGGLSPTHSRVRVAQTEARQAMIVDEYSPCSLEEDVQFNHLSMLSHAQVEAIAERLNRELFEWQRNAEAGALATPVLQAS